MQWYEMKQLLPTFSNKTVEKKVYHRVGQVCTVIGQCSTMREEVSAVATTFIKLDIFLSMKDINLKLLYFYPVSCAILIWLMAHISTYYESVKL